MVIVAEWMEIDDWQKAELTKTGIKTIALMQGARTDYRTIAGQGHWIKRKGCGIMNRTGRDIIAGHGQRVNDLNPVTKY